jgi:hypothetical protein
MPEGLEMSQMLLMSLAGFALLVAMFVHLWKRDAEKDELRHAAREWASRHQRRAWPC